VVVLSLSLGLSGQDVNQGYWRETEIKDRRKRDPSTLAGAVAVGTNSRARTQGEDPMNMAVLVS